MKKSQRMIAFKSLCPVLDRYRAAKRTESVICKIRTKINKNLANQRALRCIEHLKPLLASKCIHKDLLNLR
jgi:hypothetical protein